MARTDLLGWLAASLMLAAFVCRDVKRLRALAILANVAFIAYGTTSGAWPICALHTVLLPINVWRLLLAWRASEVSREPTAPRRVPPLPPTHPPTKGLFIRDLKGRQRRRRRAPCRGSNKAIADVLFPRRSPSERSGKHSSSTR